MKVSSITSVLLVSLSLSDVYGTSSTNLVCNQSSSSNCAASSRSLFAVGKKVLQHVKGDGDEEDEVKPASANLDETLEDDSSNESAVKKDKEKKKNFAPLDEELVEEEPPKSLPKHRNVDVEDEEEPSKHLRKHPKAEEEESLTTKPSDEPKSKHKHPKRKSVDSE